MQASTDVQPPQRRTGAVGRLAARQWFRWTAVGLVLVVVAGVVLLVRGLGRADEPTLTEQLAAEVVAVLEAATPEEHADHGHHFADEGGVLCAAEVFGFDPPEATSVDQVRTVYAQHMCAIIAEGQPWPAAVRASGPLAFDRATAQVRLPDDVAAGADSLHEDRIRTLIPERYHAPALARGFTDPGVTDELRERVEAAQ